MGCYGCTGCGKCGNAPRNKVKVKPGECLNCHHVNNPDAPICEKCGQPLLLPPGVK